MYHDKRFQQDVGFPFTAFSHSQVEAASSTGFLAVEKKNFHEIATRLLSVDQAVMGDIAKRMENGEIVKPVTEEEKKCFKVINDLDIIAGNVEGSATTKKYMRNNIWSLMINQGAPSWYITLSPADIKHPICLYFADNHETFSPEISQKYDDCMRLIAKNPVAGARFFDFMVKAFIKHVLGVDSGHPGLCGDTSAYYGAVEQQGRLTLHLHILLWIKGGLTPDEVRAKIMDSQSNFQQLLVEYLESAYQGEFYKSTAADVEIKIHIDEENPDYRNPTETLPESPPEPCNDPASCLNCVQCQNLDSWWTRFYHTVNDLLFRSNMHSCRSTLTKDGKQMRNKEYRGCLDNIWGKCKARFPRPLFKQTEVDPATGALNIKKGEGWMNTFTWALTYLF